jgi:hypothetical protein
MLYSGPTREDFGGGGSRKYSRSVGESGRSWKKSEALIAGQVEEIHHFVRRCPGFTFSSLRSE